MAFLLKTRTMSRCHVLLILIVLICSACSTHGQCVQTDFYDECVPSSREGFSCDSYDATAMDWNGFRQELMDFFKADGTIGPDDLPHKRIAAVLVRATFHDAGSFLADNSEELIAEKESEKHFALHRQLKGTGGADGSMVLSPDEQNWRGNNFPFAMVPYVRGILLPMANKYGCSVADAIQVAGAVATCFLAESRLIGPNSDKSLFQVAPKFDDLPIGRCDNSETNPEVLPSGLLDFKGFAQYWRTVGISIRDAAALMGSHSVVEDGPGRSDGVQQFKWSNKFFSDGTTGIIAKAVGFVVEWSAGRWHYTPNDGNSVPQNVPSSCPFKKLYSELMSAFASDERKWDIGFVEAFYRMSSIGAKWSPVTGLSKLSVNNGATKRGTPKSSGSGSKGSDSKSSPSADEGSSDSQEKKPDDSKERKSDSSKQRKSDNR
eukprot:Nk52_evm40s621 gene=Nk52_evmTU40s621